MASFDKTSSLLQSVSGIIKNYDELYRKTGLKYNIFKIARIKEKEVIMCKVIADLLNPKGSHYKGALYLNLFLDIISKKNKNFSELDTSKANVITEYSIDAQRRIDIVIEDGNIFIPIEVKIYAGEQHNQIKDYAEYAKKRNKGIKIPVLYLTLDGREAKTADKTEYVSISFSKDILNWLNLCSIQEETEKTPPVREVIKQLIEAIKSILGFTEDKKMNEEISKLIFQSDDALMAANEIKNALDAVDDEKWNIFKSVIFDKVKNAFPDAYICDGDNNWKAISVPLVNKYTLYVNYDWAFFKIEQGKGKKISPEAMRSINEIMQQKIGVLNVSASENIWENSEAHTAYPGMEQTEKALYNYLLYKKYRDNPDEAAKYIAEMAIELEKV